MMNVDKKSSLADKIAGILNTAPSSFDPEDDHVDATTATVLDENVDDFKEDEEILSKFRRANVDLLADLDEKYAGKKTSRKNLKNSDSEEDADGNVQSEEDEEEESDQDDNENESMTEKLESEDSSSEEDAEEEEEADDEEGSEQSEDDDNIDSEDDSNFKHITETNVSNQIKKGICVRNQMALWENLLEVRIQLQKCLLTANKMPKSSIFNEIKKESGPEFSNKINDAKNTLSSTLDKLVQLQNVLQKQFPETKNLSQVENHNDEDDEEIPSDSEHEKSLSEEEKDEENEQPKRKKRKLEEYEKEITEQHKKYKDYRNNVIQKWNDKTRVVMKGATTSYSVLDQIEYNLSNKDKLLKRTQMKRSQYTILGEETNDEEHNPEIFDDDDFYHQLLRELIEVKSADVTDPIQLGRQWIQLQNLRSKMKRKIDTKATKGRKIRYAVHNKLVNFMAPMDANLWTDDAKNELYNSLFGKNQPVCHV